MVNKLLINITIFLLYSGYSFCKVWAFDLDWGKSYAGVDELLWQESVLRFVGLELSFENIIKEMGYPGGYANLGFPLIAGIFFKLVGDDYVVIIIFKAIWFIWALLSLRTILGQAGFSNRAIIVSQAFLALYHPLIIGYGIFLRDDLIIYWIIICLSSVCGIFRSKSYVINLLVLSALVPALLFTRPHSIPLLISLLFFFLPRINDILIAISILTLSFIFFYFSTDINFFLLGLSFIKNNGIPFYEFFPYLAKWILGPNPYNMLILETLYSPLWYFTTFVLMIYSLFLREFYQRVWSKKISIFLISMSGFLPYAIAHQSADLIGPRQFAMSGFFLFVILYSEIFGRRSYAVVRRVLNRNIT
jgi:hypothetical protein